MITMIVMMEMSIMILNISCCEDNNEDDGNYNDYDGDINDDDDDEYNDA